MARVKKDDVVFFTISPVNNVEDLGLEKDDYFHGISSKRTDQKERLVARLSVGIFPVTLDELLDPEKLEQRLSANGFSLLNHPDNYLFGFIKGLKDTTILFTGSVNYIIAIGKKFLLSEDKEADCVLCCLLKQSSIIYLGSIDANLKNSSGYLKEYSIAVLVEKILL